ncbi:hypothetical protein H5410_016139 [Solanum commersonii]|uniref:Uncharacterized protein n=1 Tax=Solanum commersonii TaxID=4109 RepID=A0A9J5ZW63_SOLCO|nr:hypothetical protein H5410_016139 [Solanum commersonii]
MNAHNKTQFTYARINCVLKDSNCDTPYQRFLCSQYLLLVQVQAQQKYLNALAQRMIPYSHTYMSQFKIKNQIQRSHSKKRNTMHLFTIVYSRSKKVFLRLVMVLSAKGFHFVLQCNRFKRLSCNS